MEGWMDGGWWMGGRWMGGGWMVGGWMNRDACMGGWVGGGRITVPPELYKRQINAFILLMKISELLKFLTELDFPRHGGSPEFPAHLQCSLCPPDSIGSAPALLKRPLQNRSLGTHALFPVGLPDLSGKSKACPLPAPLTAVKLLFTDHSPLSISQQPPWEPMDRW